MELTFDKDTGLLLHAKEKYLNSNSSDYTMWFNHTIERTLASFEIWEEIEEKSPPKDNNHDTDEFPWNIVIWVSVFASVSLIAVYLVFVQKVFHREGKGRPNLAHNPKRSSEKT